MSDTRRMRQSSSVDADQGTFLECYRGRQSWLHHAAYMRMAKVLLALTLCRRAEISLEGRDILDYGFGAGTFFRYCPPDSRLFGVEIDPQNVGAVREMLQERGCGNADLRTIEIAHWESHALLDRQYDVILCSHVLEHLPDPVTFMKKMRDCLAPSGVFLGLVPLNERIMDPHHVQQLDRAKIHALNEAAGLRVQTYLEADPWLYWFQPLFTRESGMVHKLAQGVSIALGLPATLLGADAWFAVSKIYAAISRSQPTQAAFLSGRA